MKHDIPVSFGPVDRARLPATLSKWYDALSLLEADFSKSTAQRMYEARSSNGIDIHIINNLCSDHNIDGLAFLNEEIACVCGDALAHADAAFDVLVHIMLNGTSSPNDSGQWNLTPEERALLADEAHPLDRVRKTEDNVAGLLRLLRRATREAMAQQRCLLFVAPQP